jgi:hypothetical protein
MGSQKTSVDRINLSDIPTYSKMFERIKSINLDDYKGYTRKRMNWVKAASTMMLLTGCRCSEMLLLRKKDIRFFGFNNNELLGDFDISQIASMQFNLFTEKNRKNKYRVVPVVKNSFFIDMISIVYDYYKTFEYDDSFLFPYTRQAVWYAIKAVYGNDMFPHFLRHIAVTNDTKAGISPSIIKSKYGWTDLRPHSIYSHLNWFDIQTAQTAAWGTPAPAPQAIELNRPSWMKGEDAQIRDLDKKIEHCLHNNEKFVPRNFDSIEEALKSKVTTGDTINGKVVVIFSRKHKFLSAKKRFDGNKFFLIYAKDDVAIKEMTKLGARRSKNYKSNISNSVKDVAEKHVVSKPVPLAMV